MAKICYKPNFRNRRAEKCFIDMSNRMNCYQAGEDNNGQIYFAFSNGIVERYTIDQFCDLYRNRYQIRESVTKDVIITFSTIEEAQTNIEDLCESIRYHFPGFHEVVEEKFFEIYDTIKEEILCTMRTSRYTYIKV